MYLPDWTFNSTKNYIELIKGFNMFLKTKKDINLIIIGDGEKRELTNYIQENNISNCYLLGFKANHLDI